MENGQGPDHPVSSAVPVGASPSAPPYKGAIASAGRVSWTSGWLTHRLAAAVRGFSIGLGSSLEGHQVSRRAGEVVDFTSVMSFTGKEDWYATVQSTARATGPCLTRRQATIHRRDFRIAIPGSRGGSCSPSLRRARGFQAPGRTPRFECLGAKRGEKSEAQ